MTPMNSSNPAASSSSEAETGLVVALVQMTGEAAKERQHVQARKATMKKVGKVVAVAGAAAATVVAARAVAGGAT